jgi:hypothetical protein
MKEWNRTDVQGLAIINHQRNLPALDRALHNNSKLRVNLICLERETCNR